MEDIAFNNERQSLCSDCRLLACLQSVPKPEATDSAQTWSVDESFGSLGRPLCIVVFLCLWSRCSSQPIVSGQVAVDTGTSMLAGPSHVIDAPWLGKAMVGEESSDVCILCRYLLFSSLLPLPLFVHMLLHDVDVYS